MPALFDDVVRSSAAPRSYAEDTFGFLNRVTGQFWERIRDVLNSWYEIYPDDTGDLRNRFRSRDHRQHYGAWWELYVHQLLLRLGFRLTLHPEIEGSSGRPDFLATRDEDRVYVEAVTTFSGIVAQGARNNRLQLEILDIINTIDAADFFVSINFSRVGETMPGRAAVTAPIEAWLADLDPDDYASARHLPTTRVNFGEWLLELRAIPRSPEHRGKQDNRLVGTHGAIAGFTNDREQLYRALTRKKKQHGTPNDPMVIAVLATNSFVDTDVITDALFGSSAVQMDIASGATRVVRQPDGFWVGQRGVSSKKISAVLMGIGIVPETCARTAPQLWHHFDPTYSLDTNLPFATARVANDQLRFSEASASVHDLLGLAPDWPGPEPAFER